MFAADMAIDVMNPVLLPGSDVGHPHHIGNGLRDFGGSGRKRMGRRHKGKPAVWIEDLGQVVPRLPAS